MLYVLLTLILIAIVAQTDGGRRFLFSLAIACALIAFVGTIYYDMRHSVEPHRSSAIRP